MSYNNTECRLGEKCTHLHICKDFAKNDLCDEDMCHLSHDFSSEHNIGLIETFKMKTLLDKGRKGFVVNDCRKCQSCRISNML